MCHFHFNAIHSFPLPAFSIPALEHTHSTLWIRPCTHPKSDIFAYPELISENPIWGAIHNLIIGRSCQVLPFSCVPFSPCVSCCGCRVLVFFFLLQNIPYGSCSVWLVTGYTHAYQKPYYCRSENPKSECTSKRSHFFINAAKCHMNVESFL